MNKFIKTILISLAFIPSCAFAQFTLIQGGTGTTSIPTTYIPFGQNSLHIGTSPEFSFSTTTDAVRISSSIPTWFPPTISSGGSLTATTTYYYKIVAHTIDGTTLPSAETSTTTTSANKTINLNWALFPGATSYDIYRTTTSGVYGATSFLTNILSSDAYTNWLFGVQDIPYGRNTFADDGSISLSAGTPPTVNTAYLNKVGTLNHLGGTVFYQAPLTANGTSTMWDSSTGLAVPATSPIQIDPNCELSDSHDCPVFTVGKDTLGFVGNDTLGLWWESADIGSNQFHLRNLANTYNANFKAGGGVFDTLTVTAGNVIAQGLISTVDGNLFNEGQALGIYDGVSGSGFNNNRAEFANSWNWNYQGNVYQRFGANIFSLAGGAVSGATADCGANRLVRFNVCSIPDGLVSGTMVDDGFGGITGTGSHFLTEIGVGSQVRGSGSVYKNITAIADDTHMTASGNTGLSGSTIYIRQGLANFSSPAVPNAFAINGDGHFGFDGLPDPNLRYLFNDSDNSGAAFTGQVSLSSTLAVAATSTLSGPLVVNATSKFNQNVTLANAKSLTLGQGSDVIINATTGTKIGQSTSLIGFFGAAPVAVSDFSANTLDTNLVSLGLIGSGSGANMRIGRPLQLSSSLVDGSSGAGSAGSVLTSTGSLTKWVATSSLAIAPVLVTATTTGPTAGVGNTAIATSTCSGAAHVFGGGGNIVGNTNDAALIQSSPSVANNAWVVTYQATLAVGTAGTISVYAECY